MTRDTANDTLLVATGTGMAAPWDWLVGLAAFVVLARWLGGRIRVRSRTARAPQADVLAAHVAPLADRIDPRPRRGRRSHRDA